MLRAKHKRDKIQRAVGNSKTMLSKLARLLSRGKRGACNCGQKVVVVIVVVVWYFQL